MEPKPPDEISSASLSRSLRANRICDQFEAAWKAGTRPKIDEFLTGIPRHEWPDLLRELLILDLHYRRRLGESPTLEQYRAEYPALELHPFADLFTEAPPPAPSSHDGETVQFTPSDAQPSSSELTRIRYLGDYELLAEIARGGMGVVYKARQVSLNRIVAVKMILAGLLATKADHDRFHSEAQAAALLDHPNIVPVFEVGEHEGQHYFSMGFVDGKSLSARLAEGPLPPNDAAELVATVAEAVEYAHRQGVIHRDIKPSNILIDCNGRPRITDFGLAKRIGAPGTPGRDSDLTATGQVLGTPSYMPPEQAAGQIDAIGPAADVYSLGALLYAAVTGRPPFQAATALETMQQVLQREPVALRQLNAAVPRDLETIVLKCLDKDPQRRYLSAQGLADDLRRWRDGRPIVARRSNFRERAVKWARRRPAIAAMSGTLAMVVLVAFTVVTYLWLVAETSRRETERLATGLSFDKGRTLCEQGDVSRGLLWLAHTLAMVPPQDADLQRAVRENLAAWSAAVCPLQGLVTHPAPVKTAVFSRDGKSVLTVGEEGKVQLRDVSSGELRWEFDAGSKEILAVALSRDGSHVATGRADGVVHVWRASLGKTVGKPLTHAGRIFALEFDSDGKRLLTSCEDKGMRLWEVSGGRLLAEVGLDAAAKAVTFSADGRRILAGGNARANLWDAATLLPVKDARTLRPAVIEHTRVVAVAFSPDGDRVLTGSGDRTARLWDAHTGKRLLDGPLQHQDFVYAVAFSPDGKQLLTAGSDQTVRLWDGDSGKLLAPPLEVQGHVLAIAFRGDGGFTAATRVEVRCWGTAAHQQQRRVFEAQAGVTALRLSDDGRTLAAGTERGRVHLWDIDTRREIANWAGHADEVWAAAFCAEGGLVTGSRDGTVKAWDATTGHRLRWELNEGYPVRTLVASPDGSSVLTGGGVNFTQGAARLRTYAGKIIDETWLKQEGGAVWAATRTVVHDHGVKKVIYATSSGFNQIRLWDFGSGQNYELPPLHHSRVTALAFHPDGRILLTGSTDGTTRLWKSGTREPLGEPMEHTGSVNAVAFAARGAIVVTGDAEGNVRFWDATTRTSIGPSMRHRGTVWVTESSPDGHTVFSASADKTVRQWDIPELMEGDSRRITLRIQALTGMELDSRQVRAWLDLATWQECRQEVSTHLP